MSSDSYQPDTPVQQGIADGFYAGDFTDECPGLDLKRAKQIGNEIGINWDIVDLGQFIKGIVEEMEHGTMYGSVSKVHDDDYTVAARIAYAHLIERPDYYTALEILEEEGDEKFDDSEAAKKKWVADQREKYREAWDAAD